MSGAPPLALAFALAFDLEHPHGRCVGLRLPADEAAVDALGELLLPEELSFAAALSPPRRRMWIGGRAAMRLALARIGAVAGPVLPDDRDAPSLPRGIAGSITHKGHVAAALVAVEADARVGVDLEVDAPPRTDIARRVLAADEALELASLTGDARAREVVLRFSAKEAIYKALDPFVRRYVAFGEVSVTPRPDGTAAVRARLAGAEGPFDVEVTWRRLDGLVLTTARVRATAPSRGHARGHG